MIPMDISMTTMVISPMAIKVIYSLLIIQTTFISHQKPTFAIILTIILTIVLRQLSQKGYDLQVYNPNQSKAKYLIYCLSISSVKSTRFFISKN
jgi:hypothetical protein